MFQWPKLLVCGTYTIPKGKAGNALSMSLEYNTKYKNNFK